MKHEDGVNCGKTNFWTRIWSSQWQLQFLGNCKYTPPPPQKKTNKQTNKFRTSTGFELMASALGLQCSTIWAMKTHTLGAGQFVNGKWLLCPDGVKTWCSMSSMYPTIKNQPLHVGNGKEWKWHKKKNDHPDHHSLLLWTQ